MSPLYAGSNLDFKAALDEPRFIAIDKRAYFGVTHTPDEPTLAERVWQVIALIPNGRVATYGQIAALAGLPRGARRVGRVLSQLPKGTRIPWHRVVNASGGISLPEESGGYARQRGLLEKEGVAFNRSGRIALRKYRWQP
jgi:methylated-DNA-protein-cysteine methyltransferase related protein